MDRSLHYLLMSDHLLFQKTLFTGMKDTGLTPGQPKVLDYLLSHNGVVQKEIAEACHIEPATLTSVLFGMETGGLIERKNLNGNRRSLYVYLNDKGRKFAEQVREKFGVIEEKALSGFCENEKEQLVDLLIRLNQNLGNQGGMGNE